MHKLRSHYSFHQRDTTMNSLLREGMKIKYQKIKLPDGHRQYTNLDCLHVSMQINRERMLPSDANNTNDANLSL